MLVAPAACKHGSAPAEGGRPEAIVAARSTEVVRREGNHLVGSGSVYLLQHAHNPVDWYPWTPEALARARDEDRPIFLSVGYASCHWCHVMEAEVFEDDEVARWLNAHFVSIKVDREERPDLDEAYMASLQALAGSGGWPMSLFLTPALRPFYGATYLPRERFLAVAQKVWEQFTTARADVDHRADEVQRHIAGDPEVTSGAPIDPGQLRAMAAAALDDVDPQWGGFRGKTKFPVPVRWRFLLHAARKWGDAAITRAVRATLDAMASGGIRDPVGGGFHRYSTDPRWEVPHFEKMLYDNAQLAALYAEAGAALGEPRYVGVAVDTLDFLLREMQGAEGGFYASFDADSGGKEGAYYVWSPAELRAVAGDADGAALAQVLGATGAGPFDGASAVSRRATWSEVAARTGRKADALMDLWTRMRPALLQARAARPRPRVDTKIVTAWNGLAIQALAMGFTVTGDARYRDAAVRAADRLWAVHRRPEGGLVRAANDGRPGAAGVLEDYAFLAGGLLELFEVTGRLELLERASTLVAEADARFRAPAGAWYESEEGATPFARTPSFDDSVEPSGSAALLHVDLALQALTLRSELGARVDGVLGAEAEGVRRRGMEAAGWLDAALLRAGPYYDVVVAGDAAAAGPGQELERACRALAAPWSVFTRVPAAGPDAGFAQQVAVARDKAAGAAAARAFVCTQGSCKAPTADARALHAQMLEGWSF